MFYSLVPTCYFVFSPLHTADIWSAFQILLFSKNLKPKLTTLNQFWGLQFFTGDFYKIDKI